VKNNKTFTLINDCIAFFYCHQRFLPSHHQNRNNKNDLLKGKSKKNVTSLVLQGEELCDVVTQYEGIVLGFYFGKQKFSCSDMTYNWVKQSISYEFFLLKTNVIHYNLDVMRIKKNMFDNIFNMIMNMKGKTKII
jgi:hypothetical protein